MDVKLATLLVTSRHHIHDRLTFINIVEHSPITGTKLPLGEFIWTKPFAVSTLVCRLVCKLVLDRFDHDLLIILSQRPQVVNGL